MDSIFNIFFEENLIKLERNGLQTRQKRMDIICHLNAIISGCCDGKPILGATVGSLAVQSAINYHKNMMLLNSNVCLMGKYHNILYIALKVCWDWSVNDSSTVTSLLNEIYLCEKTFERLFLGAIFGTNSTYFICGWRCDFKDQDENTRAMVYFLHHATISSLKFPVYITNEQIENLRFIDIPIESCGRMSPLRVAIQANAPDILLILLRYGANPLPNDGNLSPIFTILEKLLEYNENTYQLVSCLKLLIRSITTIQIPCTMTDNNETQKEIFMERYKRLIDGDIINVNYIFGIPKLIHLSRCTIRSQLRENCQLPLGIKLLPIPKKLKRYIDLID